MIPKRTPWGHGGIIAGRFAAFELGRSIIGISLILVRRPHGFPLHLRGLGMVCPPCHGSRFSKRRRVANARILQLKCPECG